MGDYQDYGDEESELANSIKEKLSWYSWWQIKTFLPSARPVCLCPPWLFYSTLYWWLHNVKW
jgi:hypothetical protein